MKWQTRETVKRAAANGPKAALRASIVHWRQLCRATPEELCEYDNALMTTRCALCERYYDYGIHDCIESCLLILNGNGCLTGHSAWNEAELASFHICSNTLTTSPEWKRWQKAAHKMLEVLEGLL